MTRAFKKITVLSAVLLFAVTLSIFKPGARAQALVGGCNTGYSSAAGVAYWAQCATSDSGKVKAMVQCVNVFNTNGYFKYGPSVATGKISSISGCGFGEHVYLNNVFARQG